MSLNQVTSFAVRRIQNKFAVVAIMRGRPGGFPMSYEDGNPMSFDNIEDAQRVASSLSSDKSEYNSSVSPYNNIYDI